MKMEYDPVRALLYIWFGVPGTKAARTETVAPGLYADFDRDGTVLGGQRRANHFPAPALQAGVVNRWTSCHLKPRFQDLPTCRKPRIIIAAAEETLRVSAGET